jgi:hypothetical protein
LESIQRQHDEKLQRQSNELYNWQEGIMAIAYDIDEVRRRLDIIDSSSKLILFLFK